MELLCENLVLRSITSEDTDLILKWRNNENVKKYFIDQRELRKEDHMRWLKTKAETGSVVQFIITQKENGRAVGTVFLKDIDYQNRKAEYGVFLGEEDFIGKGIGTAVAGRMISYAFQELKLHKVYLRVFEDNLRAVACYEKAGFQKEALLKDDVLIHNEFRNIIIMGILNTECL